MLGGKNKGINKWKLKLLFLMAMNAITLIFPHQLYEPHPAVGNDRRILLVEEWLFFQQYQFHKLKLVLHRASMKTYQGKLEAQHFDVEYVESGDMRSDVRELISWLAQQGVTDLYFTDPVDNWLSRRIRGTAAKFGIALHQQRTPNFINTMEEVNGFFDKRQHYFQTDFYKWQREQRNILLEKDGSPVGGKWTFDTDNRKKLPAKEKPVGIDFPPLSEIVKEAIRYVDRRFRNNYGDATLPFENAFYPTSHEQARKWLDNFLRDRFFKFGIYEDAIAKNEHYLYHSVLTPMLNIGLLTPQSIVERALDAAVEYDIPINSLEGFIRQVMGWREYIRIVYEREGSRQRTTNYWSFSRKIPSSFWTGNTGITPVDTVIRKVLKTGYSHHIERLMIMGNFFVLCEFNPDDVYRWFMEMYIDAYDWVMVPNVYGMTQFSDGGLMVTKPYISGSNYILKMSDFKASPSDANTDWATVWDALFWRFMHVHRDFFLKNPRIGMLIKTFDKMPAAKRLAHLDVANSFLQELDASPGSTAPVPGGGLRKNI